MLKYKSNLLIVVLVLILGTLGSTIAQDDDMQSVTFAATEDGLSVPETATAGWVEVTFENETEALLFAILGRLDDGATMDEFMGALMGIMGGDASIVAPATFMGSPATMPGTTQTAIYNLAPGTYVLLNVGGEEPDMATFVVEGEADESDYMPESDMTVSLVDFAFGLPETLPAGEQTWMIENVGEQWHEMVFIPVPEGSTMEDAMMMMMEMEGGEEGEEATEGESDDAAEGEGEGEEEMPSGPEFAMLWAPMSAGENAWVHVDLAPGTYLVSCFIEDSTSEDMKIHAELGMMQIVTVTEESDG